MSSEDLDLTLNQGVLWGEKFDDLYQNSQRVLGRSKLAHRSAISCVLSRSKAKL